MYVCTELNCRYNAMGMNNPRICCPHKKRFNRDCCYSHGDGLLWTNKSLSAEWPYVLNKVLDSVSKRFKGMYEKYLDDVNGSMHIHIYCCLV